MRRVLSRVLVPAVFLAASAIAPAAVVEAAHPITVTLGGRAIYMPDEAAQFTGRVFNEASGLPVIVGAVDLFVDGDFAGQTTNDLEGRFAFTIVLTGDAAHRLQAVYSRGTILWAASAEFVVGPGEIDQQQSVIDTSVGGLFIGGSSDQQLAQTFTAGRTTTLEQVRAPISCDAGSTLVVEIRDVENDTPGQMVLSRAEFPASGLPSFSAFNPPSMRSLWIPQLAVTKGQQLAIYLHAAGSCGIFQGPAGDSYAAGSGFYWVIENGGQWLRVTTEHEDLPFQTIVPALDAQPEPAQAQNVVEGEIAYVTTGDLADSEQKAACATQTLGEGGQGLFGWVIEVTPGTQFRLHKHHAPLDKLYGPLIYPSAAPLSLGFYGTPPTCTTKGNLISRSTSTPKI